MQGFSLVRILKVVLSIVTLAAIMVGIYFAVNLPRVKIAAADLFHNSRENYLDCEHLTFYVEAEKSFKLHQDVADKVKLIPGVISFAPEKVICKLYDQGMVFTKGQGVVVYKDRVARKQVEDLIGSTFFGIPYRGYEN